MIDSWEYKKLITAGGENGSINITSQMPQKGD
jgi:hypothetical protein